MSNIQTVKNLLENVVGITVKYEPLHREHRFNIFTIFRRGHEEVALHSRFIAELLDPNGKHGHGDEFLKLFLQPVVGEQKERGRGRNDGTGEDSLRFCAEPPHIGWNPKRSLVRSGRYKVHENEES